MFSFSGAKGAAAAITYHVEVYRNGAENYYTAGDIEGRWVDTPMARHWGLVGAVDPATYARLAHGQHPWLNTADGSPQTLIRSVSPVPYQNAHGRWITPQAHRAIFDFQVAPGKDTSVTWAVAKDDRIRQVHIAAGTAAVQFIARYAQARPGGHGDVDEATALRRGARLPITTGQLLVAAFEHDSARPVNGYAAPQLHTHFVVFNMTQAPDRVRSLQPRQLFRAQRLATAIYRTEMAAGLRRLGYAVMVGPSGEPRIQGFTQAYLDASSPRRAQVRAHLATSGRSGAKAAQIAALATRDAKIADAHADMQARHLVLAAQYGDQPQHAYARALAAGPAPVLRATEQDRVATTAVDYAIATTTTRSAVVDDRDLLTEALVRSMGRAPMTAITQELQRRQQDGRLLARSAMPGVPARAWTTPEMVQLEQQTTDRMRAGAGQQPRTLAPGETIRLVARDAPFLNTDQVSAATQILANRDTVQILNGVAGSGKTTLMRAVRAGAEAAGYQVIGLAPTTTAAQQLAASGLETRTLQRHLLDVARTPTTTDRRFYILSESSLASTVQMHALLMQSGPHDRFLLEGDTRQHQSVDAGRIYDQLIDLGLTTTHLTTIIRQQDEAYRAIVQRVWQGDVVGAVRDLDDQGLVTEIPAALERLQAVADDYADRPDGTLVIAPDNESRHQINDAIHAEMVRRGLVTGRDRAITVLVARQDLTPAERAWAGRYEVGNTIRYSVGSPTRGIAPGSYATVVATDPDANRLTVRTDRGVTIDYDPSRLKRVSVYRSETRTFAVGDQVQFTQPFRDKGIANGQLGTIEHVTEVSLRIRDERGRSIRFGLDEYRHLDYGYAVTSYKSQSLTGRRVLVHINTDHPAAVDDRAFFVALSRGTESVRIYTDCAADLARVLSRDTSHRSAIEQQAQETGMTR